MARPILGQDYPLWNSPILDQEYPRWNNLFDTMNFDDRESFRKILQAASTAEKFHPFNLKLLEGTTLSDSEMIAVRDLSYAFNRNYLCRDVVRHLISFSRHDDKEFTLGKETKFYTEILKNTDLSPVRQPMIYLQVRREFCFRAPDLEDLDEGEAMAELNRWASWGLNGVPDNKDAEKTNATQGQNDKLVDVENRDISMEDGTEAARVKDEEEAEIFEVLHSTRSQNSHVYEDAKKLRWPGLDSRCNYTGTLSQQEK
ncbi:hypothetical protein OCU04_007779 [Sclerotinia nivalis]|uniref:Uncharacterized protein n=1 Tax=Sclerotinia nivalis TaxID=352851 RepID=A0A9X0DIR7_9HELO|nr:hypothetical protein OCU04_007779 [Sclerotinia nivalis]